MAASIKKNDNGKDAARPLLGAGAEGKNTAYRLDCAVALQQFESDADAGLTAAEASRRLAAYGPNSLGDEQTTSALKVFLANLINPMNGVLGIALLISLIAKDWVEGIVLVVVIVTNTGLGFRQEYKSEKTMEALRQLCSPTATVIRDGVQQIIPAGDIVPGDIVALIEGDQVPADMRVVEAVNLSLNEALLTGEPMAIRKKTDPIDDSAQGACPLGDQINMCFKSTVVAYGRGRGVVVATGMDTEIGKIAKQVAIGAANTSKTPLEISMRNMMFVCLGVAIVLGIIVFAVNRWDFGNTQVLLYAIATAVAILPEGLPAVTTITMAFGVATMAKEKAIVRRLVSLEALGQVNHICSDKTGTLTEGKMSAVAGWIMETAVTITGSFNKAGAIEGLSLDTLRPVLTLFGLCNTCSVQLDGDTYVGSGDTTEVALAVVGDRHGYTKPKLADQYTFFAEYPFDSSIKRMSVIYHERASGDLVMFSKGGLESILPRCSAYLRADGASTAPMTPEYASTTVTAQADAMAVRGLRVLALAMRRIPCTSFLVGSAPTADELAAAHPKLHDAGHRQHNEHDLVFLGLLGIMDPPRPETKGAIEECHRAGIIVHMITGDHPSTAAAIARQVKILPADALPGTELERRMVMTSIQFDALSDGEVDALETLPLVIARCSPETKVKMIAALHRRGKYCAMTGDGVNDAPAIANADVGIAMGLGGADVTKQASDVTLTDDCFATIAKAIAQGRRIFANVQKFTLHLLSGNVSEVVALIIGLIFSDGENSPIFPMSPIQILWINLITSSPIALALAVEPASPKLMLQPPRTHGAFTPELMADTFIYGAVMGGLTLVVFSLVALIHPTVPLGQLIPPPGKSCNKVFSETCEVVFRARAVAFVTLSLLLLFHGINCRFARRSLFSYKWAEAKVLLWAIVLGLFLVVPLPYIPVVNTAIFIHSPFGYEWGYVAASIFIFMVFAELYKLAKRKMFGKSTLSVTTNPAYSLVGAAAA
ncbi:hypothetical protein H9P43_002508 [Blastocladiella emersonii ATCC 22665]|nr:hypothetical protein H9P43_002508 [Blastocladiella emersonii ATCC 22665]